MKRLRTLRNHVLFETTQQEREKNNYSYQFVLILKEVVKDLKESGNKVDLSDINHESDSILDLLEFDECY